MSDLDRDAARRATVAAVIAAALVVVGQGTVTAVVTGGQQPLATTERVPQTADSSQWEQAPSRTVSLSKQQMAVPYGGGSVDELQVQALTNETHVAFRLTWEDPTNDTSIAAPENYSDAAAVMLRSGQKPPITMGQAGEPVNIWYWRSHWQYGTGDRAEWDGDMYNYPHPDNQTKPGQAAGNPLSQAHYNDYGQNYYAAGFGSLSHAPTQNVHARGTREGDTWSVVFVREHTSDGEHDATFRQNETMYLAFAVWNGSAKEVNGKKSLTLQFSTLDTETGELSVPDTDGSDDGTSDESAGSDSGTSSDSGETDSGGSGGNSTSELPRYLLLVVGVAAISWAIVYWRGVR